MFDVISAYLGPRVCVWCTGREIALYSWLYNQLPLRLTTALGPYDDWVFRVGGGWHHTHHVREAGRITDHVD